MFKAKIIVQLNRAFHVLPNAERKKIIRVVFLQTFLGFMDLFGVILIGFLTAIAVSGNQITSANSRLLSNFTFLQLESLNFRTQCLILGSIVVMLLIGRTILSIYFARRVMFILSSRGAALSSEMISRLLSQPLLLVQSRTSQETVYALTVGVERLVLQVIATGVVWVADFAILFVLLLGLLVIDPFTAIATFIIFFAVGYFLYRFMHVRAEKLGIESSRLNIRSNEKIVEVLMSYREAIVRNRRNYYAREIGEIRKNLANSSAEINFLPYISKYVIETTVIIASILVGSVSYFLGDESNVIPTLAIFLTAGSRIAPAVLRLQQGLISIKNGLGLAVPTLDLIDSLGSQEIPSEAATPLETTHQGFRGSVKLDQVFFTYPGKFTPAIADLTLSIEPKTVTAIVGLSGAGKTTLVDLLLGVLAPDSGTIEISNHPPLYAASKWPGAVSYVPQDVAMISGTIRQNVVLGFPEFSNREDLIWEALRVAELYDFVFSLPEKLDTEVGERGTFLSGGQRQRLGIARAMFTCPRILVLDEATSSLDGQTEASITEAIQLLKGETTIVLIAHRLSTVMKADRVVYLSGGAVLASGTFAQVRATVPDFEQQARIMGL